MRNIWLAALLMCACTKTISDHTSLYRDDGHKNPIVAFMPVIDHSDHTMPWNLSEELTQAIYKRLASHGQLHLNQEMQLDHFDEKTQPFADDCAWMKAAFPEDQYVVFSEIVDHYLLNPADQRIAEIEEDRTHNLEITMRLRVVDLRRETPKIVLQELIHHDHSIPKLFADVDYTKKHWGTKSFHFTPVGLAHAQIIRDVTARIEDYISIANTR